MIIKLNAIDSTNAFLKRLIQEKKLQDYTVVTARKQTEGRGQMGSLWQTEPDKNLITSVFKKVSCLKTGAHFFLSMAVSLAVVKTLEHFEIPDLKIKWPNDILSANRKICGILIETFIKNGVMDTAIIGVGLNVNQLNFQGLKAVTSMKMQANKEFDVEEIRDQLLAQLRYFEKMYTQENTQIKLKEIYLSYLFRIFKPSTFENKKGERFMGFIQGVTPSGKLKILLEDEIEEDFDIKEVKLLY
ncbi:biotin--[acetyl-CoA-carboxylase] ligase [Ascidiimonas sp. W6]|uniref:biotin--[acetyl-CoA-carboxylase] ligase n=1 Tax=Ascidiimonas meishanensis TaxID=3128903 RepID=UPI0030EE5E76